MSWAFGMPLFSLRRRRESVITRADRARERRQWDLAARLYKKALDRNPRNPPIRVQYGHALKEAGRVAEAEGAYRRAIADDPLHADAHLQLGHVLKLLGKLEDARGAYVGALALDPMLADAARELAALDRSGQAAPADDGYRYEVLRPLEETDPVLANADPEAYLFLNPEIAQAPGHDPSRAVRHWLKSDRRERRMLPGVRPHVLRRADPRRLAERPFGVNFYGFLRAKSGLGTAARGYLRALRAGGIPFKAYNLGWSERGIRVAQGRGDGTAPYRINLFQINADTIDRVFRLFPASCFDNTYNIAIWAWELAAFRADWFVEFAGLDEVWGISEFTSSAIRAISPIPVVTMHPVVEPDTSQCFDRAYFGLPADKFLLYCVFDVGSFVERKNPQAVIRAFIESFGDEPGAALVVKFHSSHLDTDGVGEFRQLCEGRPDIIVIPDLLPERETASLRLLVDCVVSAHRSEGFGLNLAEALYLEIPVVATRYAGNLDFMHDGNSYLVDCRPTEIATAAGPYFEHCVWAEPSVEHLGRLMLEAYHDRRGARVRAGRAAQEIRDRFSARAIGARIRERFAGLGLDAGEPGDIPHYGRSKTTSAMHPISSASAAVRRELQRWPRHPVVSLVVAAHKAAAADLERCIASVTKQSYPFWELCLVSDTSTEADTVAALERRRGTDPRIRVHHFADGQGSIARASNSGIEYSTGEYLVMLAGSAEIAPDALIEAARALDADPTIDCLYADRDMVDPAAPGGEQSGGPDFAAARRRSSLLVVRKSLLLAIGGLPADYSGAEDDGLLTRISRATQRIHRVAAASVSRE